MVVAVAFLAEEVRIKSLSYLEHNRLTIIAQVVEVSVVVDTHHKVPRTRSLVRQSLQALETTC